MKNVIKLFVKQKMNVLNKESILKINWPPEYLPENADTHVSNGIHINASPETIWPWLINATSWPIWYTHATNVQLTTPNRNYLTAYTQFSWEVFKNPVQSTVMEYVINKRLAWIAKGDGMLAYHAWLIEKTADGCYVLTEETQQGPAAIALKEAMPTAMYDAHQLWLEQLKKLVEAN